MVLCSGQNVICAGLRHSKFGKIKMGRRCMYSALSGMEGFFCMCNLINWVNECMHMGFPGQTVCSLLSERSKFQKLN